MPPRAKITKEMITGAAVGLIRESGPEAVNARALAQRLGCSTQPIMYWFESMEDLRKEVYSRVDRMHTEYLMKVPEYEDPLLGIGLNYIRFALKEPQLFRFLFQTGYASGSDLSGLIESDELRPLLEAVQDGAGVSPERAREIFRFLAMFAHGYASIIANYGVRYEEETVAADLEHAFYGAVAAAQTEDRK